MLATYMLLCVCTSVRRALAAGRAQLHDIGQACVVIELVGVRILRWPVARTSIAMCRIYAGERKSMFSTLANACCLCSIYLSQALSAQSTLPVAEGCLYMYTRSSPTLCLASFDATSLQCLYFYLLSTLLFFLLKYKISTFLQCFSYWYLPS